MNDTQMTGPAPVATQDQVDAVLSMFMFETAVYNTSLDDVKQLVRDAINERIARQWSGFPDEPGWDEQGELIYPIPREVHDALSDYLKVAERYGETRNEPSWSIIRPAALKAYVAAFFPFARTLLAWRDSFIPEAPDLEEFAAWYVEQAENVPDALWREASMAKAVATFRAARRVAVAAGGSDDDDQR